MHIGHDSIIGKNCLIASQTGIAGCVIIEDDVTLWGQVGTNSGIIIGKGLLFLVKRVLLNLFKEEKLISEHL